MIDSQEAIDHYADFTFIISQFMARPLFLISITQYSWKILPDLKKERKGNNIGSRLTFVLFACYLF